MASAENSMVMPGSGSLILCQAQDRRPSRWPELARTVTKAGVADLADRPALAAGRGARPGPGLPSQAKAGPGGVLTDQGQERVDLGGRHARDLRRGEGVALGGAHRADVGGAHGRDLVDAERGDAGRA